MLFFLPIFPFLFFVTPLLVLGADLYNLINQAALRAASLDQALVTMADLEWAKDKIYMGKIYILNFVLKMLFSLSFCFNRVNIQVK